jgi:hypothetical protein
MSFVGRSFSASNLELKTVTHDIDLLSPSSSNAMVATRGGDEDAEGVFCVGDPAVAAQLLFQLRSVSSPGKRISFPYGSREEVETMTDGSAASSPVNICCLVYFICTC